MSGDEAGIPTSVAAGYTTGLRESGGSAKAERQLVRLQVTDESFPMKFLQFLEWAVQQADTRKFKALRRRRRGVGSESRAENAEQ
jgi:hypothetical protein